MKSFTALLLSVFLVVGLVAVAGAQTGGPAAPGGAPGSTTANPEAKPDDSPSALPRMSAESTRIFGLSPTMAILIAAALFVVVILALVSMTRNGGSRTDSHLDLNRRP